MLKSALILCLSLVLSTIIKAQSGWEISTRDKTHQMPPCLANGRIGIIPAMDLFQTREVILNNVYDRAAPYDVSCILEGINPFNLEITIDQEKATLPGCENWQQTLNMKQAVFTTTCGWKNKAKISCETRALRHLPYGGMMQVTLEADKDITISVKNIIQTPTPFNNKRSIFRVLRDLDARMPILQTTATSAHRNIEISATSGFIFEGIQPQLTSNTQNPSEASVAFTIKVKKGERYNFSLFGAVCTSEDFYDPHGESERMVVFAQREGTQKLIATHTSFWEQLWQSDIIVEGDDEAQTDIRFALYNLYAYGNTNDDLSIAPMGLSSKGYNGHIFWDAELWMFPPLLLLQPRMAQSMVNYRFDRLKPARQKARNYGYRGAMFPWESDNSGEEATPSWCLTGTFEQHITADVGIAAWNYFRVTQDTIWLREKGWPLLKNIAEFWASRVSSDPNGAFHIENVVGANEYAHGVTNNAFTNGSVKVVLLDALKAAEILGIEVPRMWGDISKGLHIEQFADGTTKEHKNYKGEIIKQADVNLLAYPLELIHDHETILKDLSYYEPKVAPEGPAMTYSIFSILYARMGNPEKAYEMFRKGYVPNKRPPFGVLAESSQSNNPYFATGAGGLLQAVIFGFGGIHLTDDGFEQRAPCLPLHWKSLTITGLGEKKESVTITR